MKLNNQPEFMPNRRKQLEEEHIDSAWRLIMHDYAEHKGKEYIELNEELKKAPEYQMSPKGNKKILNMIDKHFRKVKLQSIKVKYFKILNKVAVILIVFIAMFAVAFTSVEAFRLQVLNFLLTMGDRYTQVRLIDDEADVGNIICGLRGIFEPSYIPEGFVLDSVVGDENFKAIEFINAEGDIIIFHQTSHEGEVNIDTENAEIVRAIRIHGADGLFVLKDGISKVYWTYSNKIFGIFAQVSEAEIIKIAESIIFIE